METRLPTRKPQGRKMRKMPQVCANVKTEHARHCFFDAVLHEQKSRQTTFERAAARVMYTRWGQSLLVQADPATETLLRQAKTREDCSVVLSPLLRARVAVLHAREIVERFLPADHENYTYPEKAAYLNKLGIPSVRGARDDLWNGMQVYHVYNRYCRNRRQ